MKSRFPVHYYCTTLHLFRWILARASCSIEVTRQASSPPMLYYALGMDFPSTQKHMKYNYIFWYWTLIVRKRQVLRKHRTLEKDTPYGLQLDRLVLCVLYTVNVQLFDLSLSPDLKVTVRVYWWSTGLMKRPSAHILVVDKTYNFLQRDTTVIGFCEKRLCINILTHINRVNVYCFIQSRASAFNICFLYNYIIIIIYQTYLRDYSVVNSSCPWSWKSQGVNCWLL